MPRPGTYVTVSYALADEVDDNYRSPTHGQVIRWRPPGKFPAQVLAVNADKSLELAVYDNEPTKDNESHLIGGISASAPGTDLNQWIQE